MHLIRAVLTRRDFGECGERDVAGLTDAVWAHAAGHEGLEHIRGRLSRGGVDLVLFFRESCDRSPEQRAADLIDRVYRDSPFVNSVFQQPGTCRELR